MEPVIKELEGKIQRLNYNQSAREYREAIDLIKNGVEGK